MLNNNLKSPNKQEASEAIKKVKQAKQKKPLLTMEEAWEKIFAQTGVKKSATKTEQMKRCQALMADGIVSRETDKLSKNFSTAEATKLLAEYEHKQLMVYKRKIAKADMDKFEIVNTAQGLKEAKDSFFKHFKLKDYYSFDTETTGIDVYKDTIVGYSLTWAVTSYVGMAKPEMLKNIYVPIAHTEDAQLNYANAPLEEAKELMKEITDSKKLCVMHNATFDLHIMRNNWQMEFLGNVVDTMHVMHFLNENLQSYRLKDLATNFLGEPSDTFDKMFGKNAKFAEVEVGLARWYAAKDTYLTYELYEWQLHQLSRENFAKIKKYYFEIEMPTLKLANEMESVGFKIDLEEANKQSKEGHELLDSILDQLKVIYGDINFDSPKQLSEALYETRGLKKFLSKDAKFSTSKDALKDLLEFDENVQLILDYRKISKRLKGFIDVLPEKISPDGRLHSQFLQVGTKTNRYASRNPNFQQFDSSVRNLFLAPEGYQIGNFDFGRQETVIIAEYSRDKALMELLNSMRDIYGDMASNVYKKPYELCIDNPAKDYKSPYRKNAKLIVLAVSYGMSDFALAKLLGVSVEEAQLIIAKFYALYPSFLEWKKECEQVIEKQMYIENLEGTRRRFTQESKSKRWGDGLPLGDFYYVSNNWQKGSGGKKRIMRNRSKRQAVNYQIQSMAAVQTKRSMLVVREFFQAISTPDRMFVFCGQMHDEALYFQPLDVTVSELEMVQWLVVNSFITVCCGRTDQEIGTCWGKMKDVQEVFPEFRKIDGNTTENRENNEWSVVLADMRKAIKNYVENGIMPY